ncbi:MAG: ParB/RepB/Spo0J family partition protein [Phycisphaeraceae bacterium]|nr:ParB/RepB/Spo0J family partition protein [Phycisphaerae bacterium]MBX3393180.1 ParB/RepB/Spo0J family partition protein [Phycisphaeraceae bacterium]
MSNPIKVKRLGRGLSGLLGQSAPVSLDLPTKPTDLEQNQVKNIKISELIANKSQPRDFFDEQSLDELSSSIRQHGVIQPIIVRPIQGGFQVIAGERRWRAAVKAGLDSIPAIVRDVSDQESAEWALVENLQREDLAPMERARAFSRLSKDFGLSHAQIADRVGMDRSTVVNFVRLIELEPEIQDLLNAGKLSAGHGRAILAAPPGPGRIAMARDAAVGEWSVRRLERASSAMARSRRPREQPTAAPGSGLNPGSEAVVIDLERRIGEYLGTKVSIRRDLRGESGRLVVEYYTHDQFEGILRRMGFEGV